MKLISAWDPAHAQWLLRCLKVAPFAIGAVALWITIQLILPLPHWKPPTFDASPAPQTEPEQNPSLTLSDLAVIWKRDLRQPVVDPPPAEPAPTKPAPKLAIDLLGTAIESDNRYGVFRLSNRVTVVKPVGGRIEGFEIVSIERGRARLRNGRREYELKVSWYDRIQAEKK